MILCTSAMAEQSLTTLVFDLDGTLYHEPAMPEAVNRSATAFVARRLGVDALQAETRLEAARRQVHARLGIVPTLSLTVRELGLDLQGLHNAFARDLHPARYLRHDPRIVDLISKLSDRFTLVLYTNNNRILTDKILGTLMLSGLFHHEWTIENSWQPKPDPATLRSLFAHIGKEPRECLFVGDREEIDLTLPGRMGAKGCLVTTVEELLQLRTLLDD